MGVFLEVVGIVLLCFNEYIYSTGSLLASSKWFVYSFIYQFVIFLCLAYYELGFITKRLFKLKALVWLGNISGYGYLIHWFTLVIIHQYLQMKYVTIPEYVIFGAALIAFIVTVAVSYIYSIVINIIGGKLNGHRTEEFSN